MFHCRSWGILTWYRGYRDQPGGASRKRPFHCTSVGLKPAITPNVGNSGTQFICVGVCVRANPCLIETLNQARGIKGSLCIRNASNFISQNLLMFGISLQFSKYWMKKVDSIDLWRQTVPLKKKKKSQTNAIGTALAHRNSDYSTVVKDRQTYGIVCELVYCSCVRVYIYVEYLGIY